MNKFIISIALSLSVIPTAFFGYFKEEGLDFKMVPGNYLRISTYTSFDQKAKEWKWQPNDHFTLVNYNTRKSRGNDQQIWLFQARKSGQTELVFTHKKKQKIFRIKILGSIPNPNQTTAQHGIFNSHQ